MADFGRNDSVARDHRGFRKKARWAIPDDTQSMQRFAKELVALQPDLILSHTTPTTSALLQQTRTIPIVFTTVGDPIGSGFVASFPRPGGNITHLPACVGSERLMKQRLPLVGFRIRERDDMRQSTIESGRRESSQLCESRLRTNGVLCSALWFSWTCNHEHTGNIVPKMSSGAARNAGFSAGSAAATTLTW
jgi:hypothetical protein